MNITIKLIKSEFYKAESMLDDCWTTLTSMQTMLNPSTPPSSKQIENLLLFQNHLADIIFNLQTIREKIIFEEKQLIKNKKRYKVAWFLQRVRLLSKFKEGIDKIVNISKSFGDAYAYFFYQFDLDLLSDHYSHKRVVNNCAGIGERGELEFIKNIKHINGNFTIFHGITNILRHGDFSFVDLLTLRITEIGELKTKKNDNNTLTLNLAMLKRDAKTDSIRTSPIKDSILEKTRVGRQLLGIANILNPVKSENDKHATLFNQHYGENIEELIKNTKNGTVKTTQVSPGLAFACIKLNKSSLFHRITHKNIRNTDQMTNEIVEATLKLIKKESSNNGILLGQLLYNDDYSDKNTHSTVPLFWHPIKKKLLKQLYFGECIIMSIFNPIHLVMELEEMGYVIDSKYAIKKHSATDKGQKKLERFDLFISGIMNFLMAESYVVKTLKEIEKTTPTHQMTKVSIRIQQKFDLFDLAD